MTAQPHRERRLIVLTNDLPHPPNHGHKVDQFHRWRGFADAGWRLRLICWRSPNDPPTTARDVEQLRKIFEAIDILPISHGLPALARRLILLPRFPSHVASRFPPRAVRRALADAARQFAPAGIVLDGIYGGALGLELAEACGVPAVLRGHNIEHRYFAQQAAATTNRRERLAWAIARLGLRRYEEALIDRVAWNFDVSDHDVRHWHAQGKRRTSWAPTTFSAATPATIIPPAEKRWDLAYIGNLHLPNNLRGLAWLVDEVLPRLGRLRPATSLCIAGANPSDEARAIFARASGITLLPDVADADSVLSQGRVLINPILSGSGINIKSIDMLRYDAPIVTTPVGVAGFPIEFQGQFLVASDAEDFAGKIAEALVAPGPPPGRQQAREQFGQAGLRHQMNTLVQVLESGFCD